ncbi:MAG: ATPase [Clostridiales bacterium]|nr:ATPase [Clostridiales bacterium]
MAVSAVRIASIIGITSELDHVINLCGKSGYFHPEDALSFYSDTRNFTPIADSDPYLTPLQSLKDVVTAAGEHLDLVEDSESDLSHEQLIDYANSFSNEMEALIDKRLLLDQALDNDAKSVVEISHFLGLNLDLKKIFACKYIKVRFGRLPRESYDKLEAYGDNPYVLFFQCTSDKTHYWGVYFAPIEYVSEVDRIFSSLYFERLRISAVDSTPEERLQVLQKQIKTHQAQRAEIERQIHSLWEKNREQCQKVYTHLEELHTYFGIRRHAARYNNNFIVSGWIPAEYEKEFARQLDSVEGIEYSIEDAKDAHKHEPPVKLKNKKPFKAFEFFVDMYGLPKYGEVDPTPFVAVTYILLFGIMFGDLGQGILLSIIGALMWRLKKMKLGKALIPCGISSAFFGLVFGSVFGFEDALNPLYKFLFNLDEKPIHVLAPNTTVLILCATLGVGVALVMIAMLINIYSCFKRKRYGAALFGSNGICGLVFYASLVIGGVGMLLLHWSMNIFYVLGLLALPLLLILLKEPLGGLIERDPDWKPESWGGYLVQNIFELIFETVLSYLTNTLSFLRVGAFVLVHAGMMMMVFILAEMVGGVGYVIILMIGNIFVMGIEGLLVGIQTLRLEFYEMFSRFFEGGGRPFQPVSVKKE